MPCPNAAGAHSGATSSFVVRQKITTVAGRPKSELSSTRRKLVLAFLQIIFVGSAISWQASAQEAIIVTNVTLPSGYGSVAVNPVLNRIYISGQGIQPEAIDGTTFSQTSVGTSGGDQVDVDVTNGNFWEADLYSGTASVWKSNDTQVTTISLSDCPTGVNVDSPHRRVWVNAQCGGGDDPIWAINADTFAVIAGPIGSGGVQGLCTVNPATDRLYIAPNGVSKRINPSTFAVTANSFGTVLAANASANLIYAVSATNNSVLQIINGAPDPEVVLTNVTLPFTFGQYVGVNPALNEIYIGAGASNFVAVINATNGNIIEKISLGSAITSVQNITADVTHNRVYAMAYDSGGTPHLCVLQMQTIIVAGVPLPSGYGSVAVNPVLNRIYIGGQGVQPEAIDGTTFSQTLVGTSGGDEVDVDVTNGDFWEADLYSGTASVWNSNNTQVTTVSLSDCPTGVNVDSPHRRVWVNAQCGGGNDPIWAINADTFGVIAGPIGSGGTQGLCTVNPATDRLYIAPNGVSKRINPSTFAVTANNFGTVIAANPAANLIYAVPATNTSVLQIINAAPDPEVILTNVTLPFTFGAPAGVNPALNELYIGSGGSNEVAVLNATNGSIIETISLGSAITSVQTIAADATHDRAYAMAYNAGGSPFLFVLQNLAPVITGEPVSITVSPGGTATLTVTASGYPLNYQWTFNGTNIPGATGSSLTITNFSAANVGLYSVTITNALGSAMSQTVSVSTVNVSLFAGITVDGPIGAEYSVQSTSAIGPANWITRTNITLTTGTFIYIDYSSPTNSKQFYRAVPLAP